MIYRIRFSNIKNKWIRRPIMIASAPLVLLCNWGFVIFALFFASPRLFFQATKNCFTGFVRVWNGERVEDEN